MYFETVEHAFYLSIYFYGCFSSHTLTFPYGVISVM